jgi:hypothetical protein
MARKKKGLAAYKKRASNRNNQVVKAKENPPPMKDLVEFIVPGFAGYAGTRLASRIVHGVVIKKYPKLAKHASVLSTFGAAAGAWLAVHRIDRIKQYHTPVVVGAGIAAIQTAIQAYLPKYGWMVSDHNLKAQSAAEAAKPLPTAPTKNGQQTLGPAPTRSETTGTQLPPPIESLSAEQISDELDELDLGVLSSNIGSELSDYEMDMMIDEATIN